MRKITVFIAATIVLFAVTAFRPFKKGSSASGQGTLELSYMNGSPQHFAFHALTDASGNVSGSWESQSPGQNIRTHGRITCLTILPDGKTAIMSGVATHVTGDPSLGVEVGTMIYFKVKDNGEGSNAAPDTFSDYFPSDAGCVNFNVLLNPITGGNIQVRP